MQVAGLGGARRGLFSSRGTRDIADARGEGAEDRVQTPNCRLRPSDHHAVAAFKAPDAAAGANVNVVNSFGSYFLGAPDVVDVIGIATINQNVSRFQEGQQIADNDRAAVEQAMVAIPAPFGVSRQTAAVLALDSYPVSNGPAGTVDKVRLQRVVDVMQQFLGFPSFNIDSMLLNGG